MYSAERRALAMSNCLPSDRLQRLIFQGYQ
jgi:hypothetical protein